MRAVEMIQIDQIHVLNPRERNRRQHGEIIDNIGTIGLKRPITVTRRQRDNGPIGFDLVCGQGRLEAFKALGIQEIPALVVDAKEEDCMVMSLIENIARRQHPAIELMRQIGSLHERGYSEAEIAAKAGVTTQWANMVVTLLEKGEERLLAAVESEVIPVSLAVEIAHCNDPEVQHVLADAYTQGKLKGRKLTLVRRLLEQRSRRRKTGTNLNRVRGSRKLTTNQLKRVYEREVEKQKLLAKRSDVAQNKLLFIIEALRALRADQRFVTLLRVEGLDTLPKPIADRMKPGASA
jgi:ParB family chromosome partitioning protein